ncbi:MAG: efflux RND transporter periplasmic adaptor subunit, partial [Bacteroidota bacterium]
EMEHDQLDAQIQAARSGLQASQANRNAAERDLNRLRKLRQDELISKAEYDRAVTGWEVYDAQVKQAEANLKLLEVQLSDTRLMSPANGIISAKLVEPGEVVTPGAALYAILDHAKPWVKIYLPLTEAEQVSLNQPAIINLDAFPDLNFEGRISYIAQEAEFTPKDYLSKEERVKQVYEVKVELENSSGKLKAGIPAEVRIKLKSKSKV